jgi:Domain of unknown function (DUF1877)
MSMNAMFVQVEDAEIARFEADPDSVEALFANQTLPTTGLLNMAAAMQERLRAIGPRSMAAQLSRLPDSLRQQIQGSLDRTAAAMASGRGGDDILKLMQKHLARRAEPACGKREVLSLEKAWHGVHYLLAGTAEPGPELRSRARPDLSAFESMRCIERKAGTTARASSDGLKSYGLKSNL